MAEHLAFLEEELLGLPDTPPAFKPSQAQQAAALSRLSWVCAAMGPSNTRHLLLPFLYSYQQSIRHCDELLSILAAQWRAVARGVCGPKNASKVSSSLGRQHGSRPSINHNTSSVGGGSVSRSGGHSRFTSSSSLSKGESLSQKSREGVLEAFGSIVKPLEELACMEERCIRDEAVTSLLYLLHFFPDYQTRKLFARRYLIPCACRLVHLEGSFFSKCSAAKLIPALYPFAPRGASADAKMQSTEGGEGETNKRTQSLSSLSNPSGEPGGGSSSSSASSGGGTREGSGTKNINPSTTGGGGASSMDANSSSCSSNASSNSLQNTSTTEGAGGEAGRRAGGDSGGDGGGQEQQGNGGVEVTRRDLKELFEKLLVSDALLVKRDAAIEIPSFIRHWRKARECQASESKPQHHQQHAQSSSRDGEDGGEGARAGDSSAAGEGGGMTSPSSSSGNSSSSATRIGEEEEEGRHNYFHDENLGRGKDGGGERDGGCDVLGSDPDELPESFYFLPALKKLSSDTIDFLRAAAISSLIQLALLFPSPTSTSTSPSSSSPSSSSRFTPALILPFLSDAVSDSSWRVREVVAKALPRLIPFFKAYLSSHLYLLLQQLLRDSALRDVRQQAIRSLGDISTYLSPEEVTQFLVPLIPMLLQENATSPPSSTSFQGGLLSNTATASSLPSGGVATLLPNASSSSSTLSPASSSPGAGGSPGLSNPASQAGSPAGGGLMASNTGGSLLSNNGGGSGSLGSTTTTNSTTTGGPSTAGGGIGGNPSQGGGGAGGGFYQQAVPVVAPPTANSPLNTNSPLLLPVLEVALPVAKHATLAGAQTIIGSLALLVTQREEPHVRMMLAQQAGDFCQLIASTKKGSVETGVEHPEAVKLVEGLCLPLSMTSLTSTLQGGQGGSWTLRVELMKQISPISNAFGLSFFTKYLQNLYLEAFSDQVYDVREAAVDACK
ncbi:heat repeat-containing protein, partial [Cystoisospora suis]